MLSFVRNDTGFYDIKISGGNFNIYHRSVFRTLSNIEDGGFCITFLMIYFILKYVVAGERK